MDTQAAVKDKESLGRADAISYEYLSIEPRKTWIKSYLGPCYTWPTKKWRLIAEEE